MITLSGVRSSCDMVDTNSDLSRSAASRSATMRAFWSAIEAWWPRPSARRRWRRLTARRSWFRPAARKPATQPLRKSGTAIQVPERQPHQLLGVLLAVADEERPLEGAAAHHGRREAAAEGQRHASGDERMAGRGAELDHLARTQVPDDGQVRRIADVGLAVRRLAAPV